MKKMKHYLFYSALISMSIPLHSMQEDKQLTIQVDKEYITTHCLEWMPKTSRSTSIEQLKGGCGGARLYTVNFDNADPCVVRLLVGSFAREAAWQDIEISVMKDADAADIGPKIFDSQSKSDDHIGYIVMKKVGNVLPKEIPWDDAITYTNLGSFLKKMHEQPSVIPVDEGSLYRRVTNMMGQYTKKWQEDGIDGLSDEWVHTSAMFDNAKQALTPYERTQLVHGDLLLGNILHDGTRFWAIDWEQSRLAADPLFDVALVQDTLVPKTYHTHFMQAYCGQDVIPADREKRFNIMRMVTSCFIGLAYGSCAPTEFTHLFKKYNEEQTDVDLALHAIARNGFKRETKNDFATFGALCFSRGYTLSQLK